MDNKQIRKICVAVTLIVGNSVFMALLGPRRLFENTYTAIHDTFGYFLGDLIIKVGEGSYIIISYAIIIFIICKLFPIQKITSDSSR